MFTLKQTVVRPDQVKEQIARLRREVQLYDFVAKAYGIAMEFGSFASTPQHITTWEDRASRNLMVQVFHRDGGRSLLQVRIKHLGVSYLVLQAELDEDTSMAGATSFQDNERIHSTLDDVELYRPGEQTYRSVVGDRAVTVHPCWEDVLTKYYRRVASARYQRQIQQSSDDDIHQLAQEWGLLLEEEQEQVA